MIFVIMILTKLLITMSMMLDTAIQTKSLHLSKIKGFMISIAIRVMTSVIHNDPLGILTMKSTL